MTTAAHYRLTSDEFLKINSSLTNAQLRVYMYWKTLDPFGDRRVEICTKAIAEALGMAQRTVQLALSKLASMNMIIWQKTKSFVMRSVDRQGDHRIAEAIVGSPKRSQDRERQLELSLEATPETSQSSSVFFNLNQLDQEEIFDLLTSGISENLANPETEIEGNNENSDLSLEEARALIDRGISGEPDEDLENCENFDDEDDQLVDDEPIDDQPIDEEIDDADFEASIEPITRPIKTNPPEKPKTLVEVESFRRSVENFVLKTLNKSFPSEDRRAAYFRKFDAKSWKKWEAEYRESIKPQAEFKPFVPEKVEVAAPDSPVAQSAIAFIKAKLGIKS